MKAARIAADLLATLLVAGRARFDRARRAMLRRTLRLGLVVGLGLLLPALAQAQIGFRAATQAATAGTSTITFRAAASASAGTGTTPPTIGTIASASASGGNTTLDVTGVNLTGQNAVVVFVGYNNDFLETVTSVVIDPGGGNQTNMGAALASAVNIDDARTYIFGLVNPPQGTFTIRVTFSAALVENSQVVVYPLSGVDTASPFGTPATAQADGVVGSVTVPSAAGELVLAGMAAEYKGATTVNDPPAVEDRDIVTGSDSLATAHQDGAGPNVTFNWTGGSSGDHWAAAGVSVRPAASANLTINKPTGTVQNDVLYASIGVRPNTVTVTPPAGWGLVRRIDSTAGTSNSLLIYGKVAGASEPANYTWTLSTHTGATGGILAFSGVDTVSPVVENGQPTPDGLTHATPSVNTTFANAMLVTSHTFSSPETWTPPTGMTEVVDVQGGGQSTEINYVLQAAAGATGTKTATAAADADGGNAHIVALRPATNYDLTINKPTGTVQNDVMVASIGVRPSVTVTPPAGWSLVRRMDNATGTANSLLVYLKVAGASEPANYTWTLAAHTGAAGGIQAFSGVDTASPIDVENGQATPDGLTHATPSVTTTVANTMLVTSHAFPSSFTWTPPTGMTEAVDAASLATPNDTGLSIEANYVLQAAVGATGAKTATANGTDPDPGNAHILALKSPAVLNNFLVEQVGGGAIGTQTAGTPFSIRITARDASNNTMTSFTGTVNITSTGTLSAGGGITAAFTAGVLTSHSVTISNTGSFTITATNSAGAEAGTSNAFTVNAGAFTKLQILVPGETAAPGTPTGKTGTPTNQIVGAAFNVTVNAVDANWNLINTVTDTVGITSTDTGATLPGNAALVAGTQTFSVTLNTVGSWTVTATDITDGGKTANTSPPITVNPVTATIGTVVCASGAGSNTTLDLPGVDLSGQNGVVVFVGYNNDIDFATVTSAVIDPGGASQTSMGTELATDANSDDAKIYIFGLVNPPQGTFTIRVTFSTALQSSRGSNICAYPLSGVDTASPFNTAGTNQAASGNGSVVVPSAAGELVLAGVAGETIGTSTVAAPAIEDKDVQGGSGGTTHHLATAHRDGAAPNVTINWTHTSDHWAAAGISVRPAQVLNNFLVEQVGGGAIGTQTAGTPFSIRITARDASNNTMTSFTGTVDITSTGLLSAGSGTTASFTAGVLTSHSVTISNTGSFTITATNTAGAEAGTSNAFTVNAGAFTKLQILVPGETAAPGTPTGKTGTPTGQSVGAAFNVTVNAVDANWNLINTVTDTVGITSTDTGATLPGNAALVAGTQTFSVTLNTVGSWTVTATDITDGGKTANTSPSITVSAAAINPEETIEGCVAPGGGIAFVAAAQAGIAAPTTTLTINKPAGTVQNHVMVASIGFRLDSPGIASSDIGVTPPAGWTLVRRLDNLNDTGSGLAVYRKVAGASEPASYAWTFFDNGPTWTSVGWRSAAGGIVSFSGVDTTNPIDVENGAPTAATFTPATPSVTTTVANTMLVTSHAIANGDAWAVPPTSGMTQAFQLVSSAEMLQVSYALQATAGATGTKTATDLGPDAVDFGNAHILALRPAGVTSLTLPSWTPQANELLLVGIVMRDTGAVPSVAGNGLTWTKVADLVNTLRATPTHQIALFRASGASPTAGSIVISLPGNSLPVYAAAVRLSGVDTAVNQGIEAIATAEAGATDTADMKITVTTVTAGAMALAWGGQRNSRTLTVPAEETILVQSAADCGTSGSRVRGHMWEEVVPTPGPTELGQNGSLSGTAPWSVIGVSIKPLGGGGVPTPGSFNAFETSTTAGAITGVVKTRIAGVAFSIDVVAIESGTQFASFTDQVIVDLLGNNTLGVSLDANNCPTTSTLLQTVSPNPTITAGRSTVNIAAIADAWRDARIRVRWPTTSPTVTSCSTDNFAIRPESITSFSVTDGDWQSAGTTRTLTNTAVPGGAVHKAGRPFTVRATAVNGAGTPATTTNYAGAPTATTSDCGASTACPGTLGGLTLATSFASGQLTDNVAAYAEVGSFALKLVDSSFASVDAADSSAAEREIASSTINVGRFVPDHFAVSLTPPLFGTACSGFTYIGQAFNYTTVPVITVTAQNLANVTTANYVGALWQITNASLTGKAYSAASGTLDTSGLPGTDPVIAASGAGVGTLTFGSGSGLLFTRTAPVAPFDADVSLAINVIDADSVAYASNPARFAQAAAGLGIAFSGSKAQRFGRLRLENAVGSQNTALPVQIRTQYWNGSGFATNTADSCTSIPRSAIVLGGYVGALDPGGGNCKTFIQQDPVTFTAGVGAITLALPTGAASGSVLLTANLGTSASGLYCDDAASGEDAATAAALSHLQGRWAGANYGDNPSARAAFGLYGAQPRNFIYFRENY